MYSIYATVNGHSVCIHDDTVTSPEIKVIEPTLTLEDSSAGSLEFQLAPNNIGYVEYEYDEEMVESVEAGGEVTTTLVHRSVDLVARMVSTITVFQNGTEIWEGRVLSEDRDFNNLRSIYCEGELSYLNDTCQPYRRYSDLTIAQFLEVVLESHNSRVSDAHKFYVGYVTVNDESVNTVRETKYEKTMETITNLMDTYGGHIRIRKVDGVRYLDYISEYTNVSTQKVEFGKNLLDFTCKWDMSSLCTVLMPVGKIVQKAETSRIGESLSPIEGEDIWGTILYKDDDLLDIFKKTADNLGGYAVATYNVEPEKNYYVSCRLHGGLVSYVLKMGADGTGMTHSYKQAGSSSSIGFTDLVDQKIEVPAGVYSIMVCGWGTDIPVTLKDEIEETTGMDQYQTVEDIDDDGTWHTKGSPYVVNQDMVTKYGWIEKQLNLSDIEDAEQLYSTAKAYLQNGQFDEMSIEVSAIDLKMLGVNVDAIKMYDLVEVSSPPHGLDHLFPVSKMEIPLANVADQTYTFGWATEQSMSDNANYADDINRDLLASVSAMPSKMLTSAEQNAAAMIAAATNGFISIIDANEDGIPDELVISNTADPTICTSCWIWNVNGLGHSDHYPLHSGDTVNVAMTMDGSIVADRITTGVLRSILIQGCDIVAGGLDQADGRVLVKTGDPINLAACTEVRDGGLVFGDLNQNGTVTEYSRIRDKGTIYYDDDGNPIGRGIALTAKVFAINADQLWVSSNADPGTDALAGEDVEFTLPKSASDTSVDIKLTFRHGVLVGKEEVDPFVLLEYEPANWSTNYTDYYTKDQNDHYHKVQTQTPAPTWEADTYYERQ